VQGWNINPEVQSKMIQKNAIRHGRDRLAHDIVKDIP
jgi:hypothetical protein